MIWSKKAWLKVLVQTIWWTEPGMGMGRVAWILLLENRMH